MTNSTSPPASVAPRDIVSAAERTRWFEEEVLAHGGRRKAYLRGSFPHVRDVDDIVQESYLRIWKSRAAQPIHSAKAFLFRVVRNVALDLLRRSRPHRPRRFRPCRTPS